MSSRKDAYRNVTLPQIDTTASGSSSKAGGRQQSENYNSTSGAFSSGLGVSTTSEGTSASGGGGKPPTLEASLALNMKGRASQTGKGPQGAMWMSDVKKLVQKEAARELAHLRTIPGYKVQGKIGIALQQQRTSKRGRGISSKLVSPFLSRGAGNAVDAEALKKPWPLRESDKQPEIVQDVHRRLVEKIGKLLDQRKMPQVTKEVILDYFIRNPSKVEQYAKEVRKYKVGEAKKKAEANPKEHHSHIYPQDLVVMSGSAMSRFPPAVLNNSSTEAKKSAFGSAPLLLEPQRDISRNAHERSQGGGGGGGDLAQQLRLKGVPTTPELPSGIHDPEIDNSSFQMNRTNATVTGELGDTFSGPLALAALEENQKMEHLTSLVGDEKFSLDQVQAFVPEVVTIGSLLFPHLDAPTIQGGRIEFTPVIVASLTMNNCSILRQIQQQFDRVYGKFSLHDKNDTLHAEKQRWQASRQDRVTSKVRCGQHTPTLEEVQTKKRKFCPQLSEEELLTSHLPDGANEISPDGTRGGVGSGATGNSPTQRRTMDSPTHSANAGANGGAGLEQVPTQDQGGQGMSDLDVDQQADPANQGLFLQLISEVDSFDGLSEDSDYEPLCLVCRSRQTPTFNSKTKDPAKQTEFAAEALVHWKAMRQCVQVDQCNRLQGKLVSRQESQDLVVGNISSLNKVVRHANEHAVHWSTMRASPMPRKAKSSLTSVWSRPSNSLKEDTLLWRDCLTIWDRLQHFLRLMQMPAANQPLQVSAVEHLRKLLMEVKAVSRSLFFRWLHLVGPKIFEGRDMCRFMTFLRLELGVSGAALEAWCKLSEQKQGGWKYVSEGY